MKHSNGSMTSIQAVHIWRNPLFNFRSNRETASHQILNRCIPADFLLSDRCG